MENLFCQASYFCFSFCKFSFEKPSENLRKTFGKPSQNLWKTFGKPSQNLWKTFGKPSQNLWKTFFVIKKKNAFETKKAIDLTKKAIDKNIIFVKLFLFQILFLLSFFCQVLLFYFFCFKFLFFICQGLLAFLISLIFRLFLFVRDLSS